LGKRVRIPRPRQVFPEVAAVLIECQRTWLRVVRTVRRAIGQIPAWTAGAVAGILGIMLAISLFFIRDPVQAAPVSSLSGPSQILEPAVPFSGALSPGGRPNLVIDSVRTGFFPEWDETRFLTLTSKPRISAQQMQQLSTDGWRLASMQRETSGPFRSYLQAQQHVQAPQVEWVTAAETVPGVQAPASRLGLGILLEKHLPERSVAGQPLSYEIIVSNLLDHAIENIAISEELSSLSRVTDVVPSAEIRGNALVWNFSRLPPRAVRVLKVTLVPDVTGELFTSTKALSASRVAASARVAGKTAPARTPAPPAVPAAPPAGAPKLKLSYTPIQTLRPGDTLSLIFSVSNVGTAPAEDIELYVRLSGEFEHRDGDFVRHRIPRLAPGESRRALLQATAKTTGDGQLSTSLTMQGRQADARQLAVPIQGLSAAVVNFRRSVADGRLESTDMPLE
jgi:hypothetical protein